MNTSTNSTTGSFSTTMTTSMSRTEPDIAIAGGGSGDTSYSTIGTAGTATHPLPTAAATNATDVTGEGSAGGSSKSSTEEEKKEDRNHSDEYSTMTLPYSYEAPPPPPAPSFVVAMAAPVVTTHQEESTIHALALAVVEAEIVIPKRGGCHGCCGRNWMILEMNGSGGS